MSRQPDKGAQAAAKEAEDKRRAAANYADYTKSRKQQGMGLVYLDEADEAISRQGGVRKDAGPSGGKKLVDPKDKLAYFKDNVQDSNDEEFDPNPYYYHREMQSGQMPPGMGGGSMTGAVGMSPAFGGSGGMGGVGSFNLNANAVNAFGANAGGPMQSLSQAGGSSLAQGVSGVPSMSIGGGMGGLGQRGGALLGPQQGSLQSQIGAGAGRFGSSSLSVSSVGAQSIGGAQALGGPARAGVSSGSVLASGARPQAAAHGSLSQLAPNGGSTGLSPNLRPSAAPSNIMSSMGSMNGPLLGGMSSGGYNPSGEILAMINKGNAAGLGRLAPNGLPPGLEDGPESVNFDMSEFPVLMMNRGTTSGSASGMGSADGQFLGGGDSSGHGQMLPPFSNASMNTLRSEMLERAQSDFTMQSEDFPALPGFRAAQAGEAGGGDQSFMGMGSSGESSLQRAGTNVNSSGVPIDRYGMLGLLRVIKMTEPRLNTLALGIDLTTLGLNLNSSECLYNTFFSPWSDGPRQAHYELPSCYLISPPSIKQHHIAKFTVETLFYIFYYIPREQLQHEAYRELNSREWRYQKDMRLWFTRQAGAAGEISLFYFDLGTWEKRPADSLPTSVSGAGGSGTLVSEDEGRK